MPFVDFAGAFYNPAVVARLAQARGRYAARRVFMLVAVLLVAFALRVYRLDAQSFSDDEFLSVLHTNVPLERLLLGIPVDHTPGYWVLLHYWLGLGGDVDFSLRYFSVLWGVIAVALTYLLGRHLFSARVGLLAALLLALNPFAVYFAQEARMYAQLYVLSAATLYWFARLVEHPERRRTWLLHLLALAAALYTHYYALAIPLAEVVFLLFERRTTRRAHWTGWVIGLAGVGLLFVPWLLHLQRLLLTRTWQPPVDPTSYPALLWSDFLAGSSVPDGFKPLLAVLSMLLMAFGLRATLKTWQGRFLALVLTVPLAVTLILLTLRGSGPMDRYFNVLLPAFVLLLAVGASGIRFHTWNVVSSVSFANGLSAGAVVRCAGVGVYSLTNYWFDAQYSHPDWRAAGAWLAQHEQPGDLILFDGQDPSVNFVRYYHGHSSFREFPSFKTRETDVQVDEMMSDITAPAGRVWSVLLAREPGRGEAWLNEHGFEGDYEEFAGIYLTPVILKTQLDTPHAPRETKTDLDLRLSEFQVGRAGAGSYLPVSLTWQTGAGTIGSNLKVSLRLYDTQRRLVVALDRAPRSGFYPTSAWEPNETITDGYALLLPTGLAAGSYTLEVLLYDPPSGAPSFQATLGSVEVHPGVGVK